MTAPPEKRDRIATPAWAQEELALRQIMGEWIARSVEIQGQISYRGGKRGHDEGTFTASWCGYYLLTGEPMVLDFMRSLRDQYLDDTKRHQVHGYDEWGEVHHQSEHYMIFLTRLWHLDKGDTRTIAALEDAAHHTGNWVPGIPDWYDWERHRFRSWSIGTGLVQSDPPYDLNVPDHFKLIQIALTAYAATGKQRYLDLCCDYADHWANLILEADEDSPPTALFANEASRAEREVIYQQVPIPIVHLFYDASRAERTELHVASGSLEVFLDLYRLTGESRYAEVVKKMLPPIIEAVSDPDAEMPALLLAKYRWITGDTTYDGEIMERIRVKSEQDIARMVLLSGAINERDPILGRIGRRIDQIRWGYQTAEKQITLESGPSPASLMLGYEISGELDLATRALAKARRRMELAVFTLRDGREHGCAAHTIHAIAAGHGRSTGAGCVTTTLYPFTLGSHRYLGSESPTVQYAKADETQGLAEGVVSRWHPMPEDQIRIDFYNTQEREVTIRVELDDERRALSQVTVNESARAEIRNGRVDLRLPPETLVELTAQCNPSLAPE
jgi:hypothetical protein